MRLRLPASAKADAERRRAGTRRVRDVVCGSYRVYVHGYGVVIVALADAHHLLALLTLRGRRRVRL